MHSFANVPKVFLFVCLFKIQFTLEQPRGIGEGGRWEGDSGCGIYMYTCGQFMLIYSKKNHNIVK